MSWCHVIRGSLSNITSGPWGHEERHLSLAVLVKLLRYDSPVNHPIRKNHNLTIDSRRGRVKIALRVSGIVIFISLINFLLCSLNARFGLRLIISLAIFPNQIFYLLQILMKLWTRQFWKYPTRGHLWRYKQLFRILDIPEGNLISVCDVIMYIIVSWF